MKLSDAIIKGAQKHWVNAHIRKNPSDLKQWFIMLVDAQQQSFILADDTDAPMVSEDLNTLSDVMRQIGVREFTVFL